MYLMSYENTIYQIFVYCSIQKLYIYIYYKYTTKLIGKSKLISKNSGNFKFKNY